MSASLGDILPPMPESISTVWAGVRTSSGRNPSGIRFRSSGVVLFCHIVLGTTPNMAPPSSRKVPSERVIRSKSPSRTSAFLSLRRNSRGLLQFEEHAMGIAGMHKRDQRPVGAAPGLLVDHPDAGGNNARHGRMNVRDAQRHVMQTGPALLDVLADGGIRRQRFDEFELRITGIDEPDPAVLALDVLGLARRQPQHAGEELQGRVHVADGDSYVVD